MTTHGSRPGRSLISWSLEHYYHIERVSEVVEVRLGIEGGVEGALRGEKVEVADRNAPVAW